MATNKLPAVSYSSFHKLPLGQKFRFRGFDGTFTKCGNNWYRAGKTVSQIKDSKKLVILVNNG